jgi:hypothetical protein
MSDLIYYRFANTKLDRSDDSAGPKTPYDTLQEACQWAVWGTV